MSSSRGSTDWPTHIPISLRKPRKGALRILKALSEQLIEITGMDAITLQPAAGAHGELTGILLVRACLESRGNPRKKILIPDSAHGTNPATAAMAGYQVENLRSNQQGEVELSALEAQMNQDVAGLMLTNPNTLGVFDQQIGKIAEIVHAKGGLLYMDGANMNALVGKARPGDFGVDVMHLNLHKTFSTPHGGGGPGSGPVACKTVHGALPAGSRGHRAREMARSASSTTARKPSAACACSTATSACWCGRWPTSWPTVPTACGRPPKTPCSTPTTSASNWNRTYDLPYKTPSMHEVVFSDKLQTAIRRQDRRHRQAAHRLRLPSVYGVVPAGRARRADDRADRERIERGTRLLHRRHESHRRGMREGAADGVERATQHARLASR